MVNLKTNGLSQVVKPETGKSKTFMKVGIKDSGRGKNSKNQALSIFVTHYVTFLRHWDGIERAKELTADMWTTFALRMMFLIYHILNDQNILINKKKNSSTLPDTKVCGKKKNTSDNLGATK